MTWSVGVYEAQGECVAQALCGRGGERGTGMMLHLWAPSL